MRDTSLIEIDLAALDRNYRRIDHLVGRDCRICAVLKADAYGLGAIPIAKRLERGGCGMFALSNPSEAEELWRAGIASDLLVLRPVRVIQDVEAVVEPLSKGQIQLTLHDTAQLPILEKIAIRLEGPLRVHLDLDTGMSRGGCDLDEAHTLLKTLRNREDIHLVGISTHFASADFDEVMTQDQLVRFDEFLATHREDFDEQCVLHAANSFATLRKSHCHQHMVRVGLALLGHGPGWMRGGWHQTQATCLEPIIRWTSHLAKIRTIEPGTSVGYGATWIAKRRTVLGVVAVGYADGYPMALGGSDRNPKSACIGVLDQHDDTTVLGYASIVGRVNMDQIIIDLTDLVASHGDIVGIGSKIELLSRETEFPGEESPNHLATLAKVANTVPHELLCRLNPRIPRVYHDQALPQQTVEPKPRIISKV